MSSWGLTTRGNVTSRMFGSTYSTGSGGGVGTGAKLGMLTVCFGVTRARWRAVRRRPRCPRCWTRRPRDGPGLYGPLGRESWIFNLASHEPGCKHESTAASCVPVFRGCSDAPAWHFQGDSKPLAFGQRPRSTEAVQSRQDTFLVRHSAKATRTAVRRVRPSRVGSRAVRHPGRPELAADSPRPAPALPMQAVDSDTSERDGIALALAGTGLALRDQTFPVSAGRGFSETGADPRRRPESGPAAWDESFQELAQVPAHVSAQPLASAKRLRRNRRQETHEG